MRLEMTKTTKPMVYVMRRLAASVIITPAFAGAYVIGYALMVAWGAGQAHTLDEIIAYGLIGGALVSLAFVIYPLLRD
jgi:uncharacterized membrane protein YjfL (UPF0719 family)